MNLPYVVPRLVRHYLPERLTRFLLLRSLLIKPGLETADPQAAVRRYTEVLRARQLTLAAKRVLVFGYGGRFDVGVGLLEAGANHVILYDKYVQPDDRHNRTLAERFSGYAEIRGARPRPRGGKMTLLEEDIEVLGPSHHFPPADLVLSNSVLEHVADVEGSIRALARLTEATGLHVHFVDLRDHFFEYPFEMLTYSESNWRRWLNPTSNHNRLRLWDYRRVFEIFFDRVEIEVLQRDEPAFEKARPRIRPEFASGNAAEDPATLIMIAAALPRP